MNTKAQKTDAIPFAALLQAALLLGDQIEEPLELNWSYHCMQGIENRFPAWVRYWNESKSKSSKPEIDRYSQALQSLEQAKELLVGDQDFEAAMKVRKLIDELKTKPATISDLGFWENL